MSFSSRGHQLVFSYPDQESNMEDILGFNVEFLADILSVCPGFLSFSYNGSLSQKPVFAIRNFIFEYRKLILLGNYFIRSMF